MEATHVISACLLNLAVAFGVIIAACNAACHFEKLQITRANEIPKGCWDDGELHPFGTKWESEECEECICTRKGMQCCDHFRIAVGYNPKMCIAYFYKETCSFKVMRKDDHETHCSYETLELDNSSADDHNKDKTDENKSVADLESWENWDVEDYAQFLEIISDSESKEASKSLESSKY
ncbi:beta-microseminoprotein-like [Pelobates fuscus]|uniref:beta-microseminoprotein-like n=1 Tax=Pelobates fuscus TaxID=191477 RepID=UPI002FE44D28